VLPVAYEWVELVIVRAGTGWVCHRDELVVDGVKPRSVVWLMPNVPCGVEPDGSLELTSVFLSTTFLRSQVCFQLPPWVVDEVTADAMVEWAFPEPSQVVCLGVSQAAGVFDALDGLVALTEAHRLQARFFEASRLLFTVFVVVMSLLKTRLGDGLDDSSGVSFGSMRMVHPVDEPVRVARSVIRDHYCEHWSLEDVAGQVHVSARHLSRLFVEQVGVTPLAFRDSLRVKRMTRLLVDTAESVAMVAQSVGWSKPDRASRVFGDAVGMSPGGYRLCVRDRLRKGLPLPDLDMLPPDTDEFE
jgi:AraC-like DNA-binding protein